MGSATLAPPDLDWQQVAAPTESAWMLVHASGRIVAERNPACAAQPPSWPCIFNPPASDFEPLPNYLGPVQLAANDGSRSFTVNMRGTGGAAGTAGEAVGLYFQEVPGTTLSARLALLNPLSQSPNPGEQTPAWIFSGSYVVTATAIPSPLTLTGGPTGDSLGTVRYTLGTVAPLQVSRGATLNWWFVPGDSVPAYSVVDGTSWYIQECRNQTSCTWTPPPGMNGRLQSTTYVEGQYAVVRSDYLQPKGCQTGWLTTSGVSGNGCIQANLELTCNLQVDSVSVTRGGNIDCRAATTPPGNVISWEFVADSFAYRNPTEGSSGHTGAEWSGKMLLSGTITARATIQGQNYDAKVHVRVAARDWQGKEFPATAGETTPDAAEFTERPDSVRQLGHIHNRLTWQVARGSWEPVLTGPNSLLAYFVGLPAVQYNGEIHVNRLAQSVGSAFWQAQLEHLPRLRQGQAIPCLRSDVVPHIAVVLKHEGSGFDPASHAFLYVEEGKRVFGPAVEPIVGTSAQDLADRVRDALRRAAAKADSASAWADSAGYRHTWCTFNYTYPH